MEVKSGYGECNEVSSCVVDVCLRLDLLSETSDPKRDASVANDTWYQSSEYLLSIFSALTLCIFPLWAGIIMFLHAAIVATRPTC